MFSETYQQGKESNLREPVLPGFLKATLVAIGFTAGIFVMSALLLTYTGLPESTIPFIVTVTAVLSVIIAGIKVSKTAKSKGYLNGAAMGIFYVLLLYVMSLIISGKFYFNTYILILLAIGLFGGAVGGILGINVSAKQRRSYRETH